MTDSTKRLSEDMSQLPITTYSILENPELLMVGVSAKTYRTGPLVVKITRIDDEDCITTENRKAMRNEASIYALLGQHPSIARCLTVGPARDYIELEYYPNGTLKDHLDQHHASITTSYLRCWARQIIESVVFIHTMGVRHSDLRLDQWLLDADLNARLSDFNASGYDAKAALGLEGSKALGHEDPSHYLPRDPMTDNGVESDLFALGSVLYELVAGHRPYENLKDNTIQSMYEQGQFPNVEGLLLGEIILGCWKGRFLSAHHVLRFGENAYEL